MSKGIPSSVKLPGDPKNVAGIQTNTVVLVIFSMFIISWIATQYFAARLDYQAQLGDPLFHLGSTPFYIPIHWVVWVWKYGSIQNEYLAHTLQVMYAWLLSASFVVVITAGFLNYRRTRAEIEKLKNVHGSARFATLKDVKESGLLTKNASGAYVGAYEHNGYIHYLTHDGPEHILCIAPTRSGKGVGLVNPTLLTWAHSLFVYDIKGELWALTSGYRKARGQKAIKFEPGCVDGSSACYNPLAEVRIRTIREVADVQNIASMIVDPDGKGLADHWQKTAFDLFIGVILHVLYAEPNKTLAGVVNFLSNPQRDIKAAMKWMLETAHDPLYDKEGSMGWKDDEGNPVYTHPVVAATAQNMLNKSDQEFSSVYSTVMSYLSLYKDPIVAANTKRSDFTITDLMNHDVPVSLYYCVSSPDSDRMRPLTRLFISQMIRRLTETLDEKDGRMHSTHKHRMLVMLDEFASLRKLDVVETALAFTAGYGIKFYLIVQDFAQLRSDAAYGPNEMITANCHVRNAYAPNNLETAERLSKMTGTTTVLKTSYSYSGHRTGAALQNVSASIQDTQRALMTPDEIMQLRKLSIIEPTWTKKLLHKFFPDTFAAPTPYLYPGDMLIYVAGYPTILGKQILYYTDETFLARAKLSAPKESDTIHPAAAAPQAAPRPLPASPAPSSDSEDSTHQEEAPPPPADAFDDPVRANIPVDDGSLSDDDDEDLITYDDFMDHTELGDPIENQQAQEDFMPPSEHGDHDPINHASSEPAPNPDKHPESTRPNAVPALPIHIPRTLQDALMADVLQAQSASADYYGAFDTFDDHEAAETEPKNEPENADQTSV